MPTQPIPCSDSSDQVNARIKLNARLGRAIKKYNKKAPGSKFTIVEKGLRSKNIWHFNKKGENK